MADGLHGNVTNADAMQSIARGWTYRFDLWGDTLVCCEMVTVSRA